MDEQDNASLSLMDYNARMYDPCLADLFSRIRLYLISLIRRHGTDIATLRTIRQISPIPPATEVSPTKSKSWFYEAYGSHWQKYWHDWDKGRIKPPTCAQLGCKPDTKGSNNGTASNGGNGGGNNTAAETDPTLDNGFYTPQSGAGSICYYCYYGGQATIPIDPTQNLQTQSVKQTPFDCGECAWSFVEIPEGLVQISIGVYLEGELLAAAPETIAITEGVAIPFIIFAAAGLSLPILAGVNSVWSGAEGFRYIATNGASQKPDPIPLIHAVFPDFWK